MGAIGTPLTPHVRKAPVKKQAAATNHGHHCYDSMSTQLLPLLALSKVYVTDLDVEGVIPLDTLLGSGKRVLFKVSSPKGFAIWFYDDDLLPWLSVYIA